MAFREWLEGSFPRLRYLRLSGPRLGILWDGADRGHGRRQADRLQRYRGISSGGNRRGARLVPPNNPSALAAAMAPLVRNPSVARAMGSSNLAEARRYDWGAIATQVRLQYIIALAEKGLTTLLPSIP